MEDLFSPSSEGDGPQAAGESPPPDDAVAQVARRIEALRREVSGAPAPSNAEGEDHTAPAPDMSRTAALERIAQKIQRLRACRRLPVTDHAITPLVAAMRDNADRTQRRLGELIDLWEELVPREVAEHTSLTALRGGVLHVRANSSPIAYELDRLLREGLTAELRRRFRGTLVRVKVRIGTGG